MNRIREVQVVGDKNNDVYQRLAALLEENSYKLVNNNPDLIIVIGGDGTYLREMREMNFPSSPAIGINAGTLGYFQEVETNEIEQFIQDLNDQKYKIASRTLLEVENDGKTRDSAINEVVVKSGGGLAMKAKIEISKGTFAHFIGDGLIVSTSQGSTAYASAAGGPLVADELHAFVLVPSNPFFSTHYDSIRAPLVYSDDEVLQIHPHDAAHRPVVVSVDGNDVEINPMKPIIIRKSQTKLAVLRTHRFDYFARLSHKLVHRNEIMQEE